MSTRRQSATVRALRRPRRSDHQARDGEPRSFRLVSAGAIAALVGSVLAVVAFSTPAFARRVDNDIALWLDDVGYQRPLRPDLPGSFRAEITFTTGTATAPAGITRSAPRPVRPERA